MNSNYFNYKYFNKLDTGKILAGLIIRKNHDLQVIIQWNMGGYLYQPNKEGLSRMMAGYHPIGLCQIIRIPGCEI